MTVSPGTHMIDLIRDELAAADEPLSARELSDRIDRHYHNVYPRLHRLERKGEVDHKEVAGGTDPGDGEYRYWLVEGDAQ